MQFKLIAVGAFAPTNMGIYLGPEFHARYKKNYFQTPINTSH